MAFLMAGGGALVSGLFGGGGNSLSITSKITNDMMARAVLNSTTECITTGEAKQTVKIIISPPTSEYKTAADSAACDFCGKLKTKAINKQIELQTAAGHLQSIIGMGTVKVAGSSKPTQADPFDDFLTNPCGAICRDAFINNISQEQVLTLKSDCEQNDEFKNTINQSMQAQINDSIKNQEDIFGQLESIFAGSKASISADIANVMTENMNQNFYRVLATSLNTTQTIDITGTSIYVNKINQTFSASVMAKMKVTDTVIDQFTQSSDFSLSQSVKNVNDTTGELADDFLQLITSVSTMMDTLTGQLLMFLAAIIVCIIMVVGTLYLFSNGVHATINDYISSNRSNRR